MNFWVLLASVVLGLFLILWLIALRMEYLERRRIERGEEPIRRKNWE